MPGVYGQRGDVSVKLGDARGLFMGMIACHYADKLGSRLHIYADIRPTQVKKALTGSGRASKAQMLAEAQKWNPTIALPDEADSIGVALVALARYREEQA